MTTVCIVRRASALEIKAVDSLLIITYTASSLWGHAKQAHEQLSFSQSRQTEKEGVTTAAARYSDKGIIFIKAKSMLGVHELVPSDRAVVNKFIFGLHQKISLFYGVELKHCLFRIMPDRIPCRPFPPKPVKP